MLKARLIPHLLIDNNNLIKTVQFSKPQYIGDPLNAIKIFNEKEVDEIIVTDRTATKNGINLDLLKKISSQCFMPLTYGGGIDSVNTAELIMKTGVEKIIIRTALLENKILIKELKVKYGSQALIACVDIKRDFFGNFKILNTKIKNDEIIKFMNELIHLGIGEIMIQSVDFEGTFKGVDEDLISFLSTLRNIPLVYSGGIRNLQDVRKALNLGIHSVAAGSMFVFKGSSKGILINYPSRDSIDSLSEF